MSPVTPSRRTILTAGGVGALAAATSPAVSASAATTSTSAAASTEPSLRFRPDGTFRILQFNDTQDTEYTDVRTVQLITRAISREQPDLVVFVGDNINGGPSTRTAAMQALNNVIAPVEAAKVPWAATFGNHDEDSTPKTHWDEADMLAFFRRYPCNVNPVGAQGITGTGNGVVPVLAAFGGRTAFNVWMIDSGRYAPAKIAGQDFEGYPDWDWIRADQVKWYLDRSAQIEAAQGKKVPGLLFCHIPLWEHRFMWFASVDGRTEADHARAVAKHHIVGERNEDECPGPFNSGLYSALQHRGEVKGVFCGHDHINTYVGNYYGIRLGYGPGSGFGTYGLGGEQTHRLRGGRSFVVREDGTFSTRTVLAADLGIDMSPDAQPGQPAPLPRWAM